MMKLVDLVTAFVKQTLKTQMDTTNNVGVQNDGEMCGLYVGEPLNCNPVR
jgi:hypothetical protein